MVAEDGGGWQAATGWARRRLTRRKTSGEKEKNCTKNFLTRENGLCGGGVPSSHPSLGLSVFFLSFFRDNGIFFL